MADEPGGNTPPNNQDGLNTPGGQEPKKEVPDQNPLFPKGAGEVPVPKEEEEVDPRIIEVRKDPNFKKFMEDAKTPEMMYKRYSDSSIEAKRLAEEREALEEYQQGYEAIARDFEIMKQKNPTLHQQVLELFQGLEGGTTVPTNQPKNEEMSERKMEALAKLQVELSEFKRDYKDIIGDDSKHLDDIREFAASLYKSKDREGKPFTYKKALLAGLQYYHPEVVTDQAKLETMANVERRSSASESGNAPTGSSPRGRATSLTAEEKKVADRFGMTETEYRKYQE